MQQGLLLSEQFESVGPDGVQKQKLKLAMHSDTAKFPNSGGYVWVNERQQSKFVSVFKGSIFEMNGSSPAVILKLMYHWACQTNVKVRTA